MVRTFDRSETESEPTRDWHDPCSADREYHPARHDHVPAPPHDLLRSPCTKACGLDEAGVCTGCGRTFEEILEWAGMPTALRLETIQAAAQRLADRNLMWSFSTFEV